MKRNQSPFRIERRLTPELFDHYVAKARDERAKAVAGFFGIIAAWLTGLAGRIQRVGRSAATGQRSGLRDSRTVHS